MQPALFACCSCVAFPVPCSGENSTHTHTHTHIIIKEQRSKKQHPISQTTCLPACLWINQLTSVFLGYISYYTAYTLRPIQWKWRIANVVNLKRLNVFVCCIAFFQKKKTKKFKKKTIFGLLFFFIIISELNWLERLFKSFFFVNNKLRQLLISTSVFFKLTKCSTRTCTHRSHHVTTTTNCKLYNFLFVFNLFKGRIIIIMIIITRFKIDFYNNRLKQTDRQAHGQTVTNNL